METQTLIKDLTETQIEEEVREKFSGRHITGIDLDKLISQSTTLANLFAAIQRELDIRGGG